MKEEDYEKYQNDMIHACLQFNMLFSEYVKEMNPDLWQRGVNYAKDYAASGSVSFVYSNDRTVDTVLSSTLSQTIFIHDLAEDLDDTRDQYINFVSKMKQKNKSVDEIKHAWLKETEYTADDPFNNEKDLSFFINCKHKFNFSEFDETDWLNYVNITNSCGKNQSFQLELGSIILDILGEESDIYQYYIRCMEGNSE